MFRLLVLIRRMKTLLHPVPGSRCANKTVVCTTKLVAALLTFHGSLWLSSWHISVSRTVWRSHIFILLMKTSGGSQNVKLY